MNNKYVDIPRDDDDYRYTKSFTVGDMKSANAINFLNEYGFLVVSDVLSNMECDATLSEMFSCVENDEQNEGFRRDDYSTWHNWSSISFGMLSRKPMFTQQLLYNRQNANVYKVFSTLIGSDDLRVNHDRCAIYRPSKIVGSEYKTRESLHLDIDPWRFYLDDMSVWKKVDSFRYDDDSGEFITENNHVTISARGKQYQGIINLVDNVEEDGGFIIVPGFHNYFDKWLKNVEKSCDDSCRYIFKNNEFQSVRVTCRAGSMVIWDQRCAHGSKPNNSERMRCVQFIKMFDAKGMHEGRMVARRKRIMKEFEKGGFVKCVNDVGMKVFGL